jgi:hypothetical protein
VTSTLAALSYRPSCEIVQRAAVGFDTLVQRVARLVVIPPKSVGEETGRRKRSSLLPSRLGNASRSVLLTAGSALLNLAPSIRSRRSSTSSLDASGQHRIDLKML